MTSKRLQSGSGEGKDAFVNDIERDVCNLLHHKYTDRDRWDSDAAHDRDPDHNAKPEGVIAEFDDGRVKDRGGFCGSDRVSSLPVTLRTDPLIFQFPLQDLSCWILREITQDDVFLGNFEG